jgi:tol-pal system-associated acyl-CoA thioesterase
VSNREFSLPLRVYIEDTDAGGIVYYVNYLKFMERARTEFMRSVGFGKDAIFNHDLMFVVRDVALHYKQPARLDDELLATATIGRLGGASMTLRQSVRRGEEVLVDGEVTIACVDSAGVSPRRMPRDMLDALRDWQSSE